MEEIIKISNLSKRYTIYDNPDDRLKEILGLTKKKRGKDFYALDNVSFSVEKGKTLGIIGENGAGKSTLLKIITGVLTQTSGTVEINGRISALLELGTGFNPEYTGIENIYLSGNVNGLTKEEVDARLQDILDFADIGDFVYQKVKTYSSGMFARLAFSVAIHVDPEILIVDEALSVGDLFFQQKCNMYMKEKMDKCTKLLVTHDMATIANMADSVIVLSKGKQVFYGEPLKAIEFYTKQAHSAVFAKESEEKAAKTAENDNADSKVSAETENTETVCDEAAKSKENSGIYAGDWNIIPDTSLGGALEAKITEYRFRVNGEEYMGYVQNDDVLQIELGIESSKDIKSAMIGYQIKDKYGNIIFGENTHSSGFKEFELKAGRKMRASLSFKWPHIQENTYFLTLGLGEGSHEMQHIIQCWAHNIFEIRNITTLPNHGLFNNPIEDFRVVMEGEKV